MYKGNSDQLFLKIVFWWQKGTHTKSH